MSATDDDFQKLKNFLNKNNLKEALELVDALQGDYTLLLGALKNEQEKNEEERKQRLRIKENISKLRSDREEALDHVRVKAKANARWRRLLNRTLSEAESRILKASELHDSIIGIDGELKCKTCLDLSGFSISYPCDTQSALNIHP